MQRAVATHQKNTFLVYQYLKQVKTSLIFQQTTRIRLRLPIPKRASFVIVRKSAYKLQK